MRRRKISTAGAFAALALLAVPGGATAAAPTATTRGAESVTATSAMLTGTVNPNSEATTFHFEYGTTKSYGSLTQTQGPTAAVKQNVEVSASLSDLTPGATYHFRVVATNASGTRQGKDKTFKTPAVVSLGAAPNPVVFGTPTTLSGQLAASGPAGVKVTLEEDPFPFMDLKPAASTETDANGRFSFSRTPAAHTAYQAVADTNPKGSSPVVVVPVRIKVTLAVSNSRPARGRLVTFHGAVKPAHNGLIVKIRKRVGGKWRTVKRTTLKASTRDPEASRYGVAVRITRGGLYRATVAHDADHGSGTSAARRIRTG